MAKERIDYPNEFESVERLFKPSIIRAETELSPIQIETINKLGTMALILNQPIINAHIDDFMMLQKSKERKGLGEYVESLKAKKEEIALKVENVKKRWLG